MDEQDRPAGALDALRGVVRSPVITRLVVAYSLFIAIEFGSWVAILVFAYEASGPEAVGLVAVAQLAPAALAAPWLVRIGEHVADRTRLAIAYLAMAGLTATTGLAMVVGAEPLAVYGLAVLAAAAMTVPRPLHGTLLPALADDARELTAANGATAVAEGLGALAGPLLAGLVMAAASPGATLVLGAGLGAVSAGLAFGRAASAAPGDGTVEPAAADDPAPKLSPLGLLRDPATRVVALVLGGHNVAYGAADVALVLVAIGQLSMGDAGPGYLSAALGLGGVAGGAATFALAGRPRLSGALLGGAVGFGVAFGLVSLVTQPPLALLLLVVAGVGLVLVEVVARTLLQRTAPVGSLTAALGVVEGVTMAGLALGSFVVAPLVAIIGLTSTVVVIGLTMPVLVLMSWIPLIRLERTTIVPVAEIAALRRLPLFAPLPAPALESVARQVIPLRTAPGETIIAEGDVGDRWYTIVFGSVRVHRAGLTVRTLGPGDSFGEIALLHRVPRTASVTALTATELLALDRDPFLGALTGSPAAAREASRVASTYLVTDEQDGPDSAIDPALAIDDESKTEPPAGSIG